MNVGRAVGAGLLGGVIVDVFLFAIRVLPFPGSYQFIASKIVGPIAFSSSAYILLGVVVHFFISIVAALVYEGVAARARGLLAQPLWWGTVFGLGVWFVMQIVTGSLTAVPSLPALGIGLIAHVVFFGWPVAFFIARTAPRAAPAA